MTPVFVVGTLSYCVSGQVIRAHCGLEIAISSCVDSADVHVNLAVSVTGEESKVLRESGG